MRHSKLRSLRGALFTLAGLFIAAPVPGFAQDPGAELLASNERLIRLFSDLSPNDPVQMVTPLVSIDRGAFERVGRDSVHVTLNGVVVPVPLSHIRTVAFQSHHGLQGSLWGVVGGAVVGSMFGLIIGSFNCTTPVECQSSDKDSTIRWGAVAGIVGGGVGWLLGHRSAYWKSVFP